MKTTMNTNEISVCDGCSNWRICKFSEDVKQAEAEYDSITSAIQRKDKKMEMELNQLETERSAIQTEIDSVSKVIEDNTEKSFKTFG